MDAISLPRINGHVSGDDALAFVQCVADFANASTCQEDAKAAGASEARKGGAGDCVCPVAKL